MTDDLGRLAAAIRHRRTQELRISAREAAARAGFSRNTWVGVEGARTVPQERHRAGIESTLGWAPGSIDAILAGGAPTTTGQPAAGGDEDLDERLTAEIERIQRLPLGSSHKLRIITALVDTYEDARRVQAGAVEPEQGGQREAS